MNRLYIYYRIDPHHLDRVQRCVGQLFSELRRLGVRHATLHRRLAQNTPYITLMEVIEPPHHLALGVFQRQLDALVAHCFSALPEPLSRTLERFECLPIDDQTV